MSRSRSSGGDGFGGRYGFYGDRGGRAGFGGSEELIRNLSVSVVVLSGTVVV